MSSYQMILLKIRLKCYKLDAGKFRVRSSCDNPPGLPSYFRRLESDFEASVSLNPQFFLKPSAKVAAKPRPMCKVVPEGRRVVLKPYPQVFVKDEDGCEALPPRCS